MAQNTCEQPRFEPPMNGVFNPLWMGFLTLYKYSLMKSLTAVVSSWKIEKSEEPRGFHRRCVSVEGRGCGNFQMFVLTKAERPRRWKSAYSKRVMSLLGGGNSNIFYVYPYYRGNDPIWLIFFRWVETINYSHKFIMEYLGPKRSTAVNVNVMPACLLLARAKWELVCPLPASSLVNTLSLWITIWFLLTPKCGCGGRSSFSWQSDSRYGTSKYRDMMTRLAQDPVGQTVQFDLLMRTRSTKGTTPPQGSPTANFQQILDAWRKPTVPQARSQGCWNKAFLQGISSHPFSKVEELPKSWKL